MAVPADVLEQWKEINANARHWEALVFESARSYFTVVSLALGGAGAAIGWTGVAALAQRLAVAGFLLAAALLAAFALVALQSQKAFLRRLYARRRTLEQQNPGLELRDAGGTDSGRTLAALRAGFWIAIGLSLSLLALLPAAR
jgi:hypothetical protein